MKSEKGTLSLGAIAAMVALLTAGSTLYFLFNRTRPQSNTSIIQIASSTTAEAKIPDPPQKKSSYAVDASERIPSPDRSDLDGVLFHIPGSADTVRIAYGCELDVCGALIGRSDKWSVKSAWGSGSVIAAKSAQQRKQFASFFSVRNIQTGGSRETYVALFSKDSTGKVVHEDSARVGGGIADGPDTVIRDISSHDDVLTVVYDTFVNSLLHVNTVSFRIVGNKLEEISSDADHTLPLTTMSATTTVVLKKGETTTVWWYVDYPQYAVSGNVISFLLDREKGKNYDITLSEIIGDEVVLVVKDFSRATTRVVSTKDRRAVVRLRGSFGGAVPAVSIYVHAVTANGVGLQLVSTYEIDEE